ncbi:flagellar hook assembly protein FlgD [Massilia sp. TS11]|uniref:flagellar hook assembly protein FlgD n=1 Tax=Massilia sp. TS11 TaxID=2908003 RepID=UPI001EDC474B|nr:flagellar hook assembly protein FlgD [Massilia sp. TS11]MCG2582857.1 flagellar hook assembly protein FlgD [Massilia sp. TS11]
MATITSSSSTGAVDPALLATMNPQKQAATDSVQADTDKFMTLLVTQLKNQDPLNPLDNAQVTSQLAQLSTVTGINKLNETLNTLKSSYQSSEALQATSMIGHGVLTPGDGVKLKDSQAIFGVDLATAADDVKVTVFSPAGQALYSMDLGAKPAGTMALTWDGTTDGVDGAKGPLAKDGNYYFKVEAVRGQTTLKDATALSFGQVQSVTTNATDGVKLTVPGVGVIKMSDVKQIL